MLTDAYADNNKGMIMDTVKAITLQRDIVKAFTKIGTPDSPQAMPPSQRNDESYIYELYVAKLLFKLADARKKLAEKAAIAAGCIGDYEKTPHEPHDPIIIYDGDIVEVRLFVRNGIEVIDTLMLIKQLRALGVKEAVLEKAIAASTKKRRAPHTILCELNTNADGRM